MKKILVCCIALFWCAAAVAAANPFDNWYTYYYLDKNPAKVPDYLKWVEKSGMLATNPEGAAGVQGFLSIVFAENPASVQGWEAGIGGKTKEIADGAAKTPIRPDAITFSAPYDLDKAWGAYFASGDTAYLARIVSVLDPAAHPTGNVKTDDILRNQIAISLGSNMTQHESVERYLASESGRRTDAVGNALKNIMSNVRAQREAREFPHHDGEFSGIMIIADPAVVAKAFSTPGDIVHLKEMPRGKSRDKSTYIIAHPGTKLTFVIVFAGMQLTPDYLANVTYDAQLIDPEGKIYSDPKDLEAIKQKVPTRFRVFSNKAAVMIAFNSKDTFGFYKINVTLKDNVGKKSISFSDRVKLRK